MTMSMSSSSTSSSSGTGDGGGTHTNNGHQQENNQQLNDENVTVVENAPNMNDSVEINTVNADGEDDEQSHQEQQQVDEETTAATSAKCLKCGKKARKGKHSKVILDVTELGLSSILGILPISLTLFLSTQTPYSSHKKHLKVVHKMFVSNVVPTLQIVKFILNNVHKRYGGHKFGMVQPPFNYKPNKNDPNVYKRLPKNAFIVNQDLPIGVIQL